MAVARTRRGPRTRKVGEALRTNVVLSESGVAFGTSGARGLVESFTAPVCAGFAVAFLNTMRCHFDFDRVAVGIDLRPSSPDMAAACIAGARQMGVGVDYCGPLPTPALAHYAMGEGIPAIMITGSHIPFDRNGIKFYRPDGEITKVDEQEILSVDVGFTADDSVSLPPITPSALNGYQERYNSFFPAELLKGWRVGVYQHSGVARDFLPQLLCGFGAEIVALGRTDQFVPIDTEAVSEADRQRGQRWAKQHNLDAIVSTDGDADRPLIADENGHWLRGDVVGLITAKALGVDSLAVPVSCNTAIEASGYFGRVERTRIGSPYVIAAMQRLASSGAVVAGFEANGGFLLGSEVRSGGECLTPLPTRDAVLPMLAIFAASRREGKLISALVGDLPARYTASDRLQDFPVARSRDLLEQWQQSPSALLSAIGREGSGLKSRDLTDGARVTLDNGDIVHLRPSGNAPELRCYVESSSVEGANVLLQKSLSSLIDAIHEN